MYLEDDSIVSQRLRDYLQSSRFCSVFQAGSVYFKKHTMDAMFPLCLALAALFSQRPVFSDTHIHTNVHSHEHWLLPLGPIIVPIGTPWRPITTAGGTKKTSFILLACCLSLSFWFDFSFYVALFPFIKAFLPLPPVYDISFFPSISPSFGVVFVLSFSLTPVVILAPRRQA